jgi:hypothetical protein
MGLSSGHGIRPAVAAEHRQHVEHDGHGDHAARFRDQAVADLPARLVAVPAAAGARTWAGITLAPAVGAILMSASTIVVALNAQLLRRLDHQQRR